MKSRVVLAWIVLQCFLTLNAYKTSGRHLPTSRGHATSRDMILARDDRSNRVVRLPPLVPPLHGDSSLVARQVFSIPRVGKSVEDLDTRDDDPQYSFTSLDKNDIDSDDDDERTVSEPRRNVFSKIPRVGRRWSSYDQNRPNRL